MIILYTEIRFELKDKNTRKQAECPTLHKEKKPVHQLWATG
jgi:hypothetical protein